MGALAEGIAGLEERLRYRRIVGVERIPESVARGLLELLGAVESISKQGLGSDLERVAEELRGCSRCGLHRSRSTIVVGEGNPRARLVFVGEGPGEEEDAQGRPFVGPAGQLLTKIIQAMGLRREDVYIANVVKCRPPANRTPKPDEISACKPFLVRQLRAIGPKVICALGGVSTQTLLEKSERISRLRGRFHPWEGIPVMPTFHPSYLLRNPEKKRVVWEDVKQVMEMLK